MNYNNNDEDLIFERYTGIQQEGRFDIDPSVDPPQSVEPFKSLDKAIIDTIERVLTQVDKQQRTGIMRRSMLKRSIIADIVANKVIEQVPEGFSYEFRDIKERAMFHLKVQGIQESGTKDESCPPGYFWCSVDKECKKEVEEENGDDEEEEKKGKKIIDTGGTDIDQLGSGRKPRR